MKRLKRFGLNESTLTWATVRTYHVSKTFSAPLRFVFSWCTDYREDDMRMIGSKRKRHILERTKKMVVWRVEGKDIKTEFDPIRVVWLKPPDSWHLDCSGDETEVGDYTLTSIGRERTRLEMTFRTTYYDPKDVVSRESYLREAKAHWDAYGRYLEHDYRRSLKG